METLELLQVVEHKKVRGAWKSGVKAYAVEMLENAYLNFDYKEINSLPELRETLLNGAEDWKQYAYGGMGLVYDHAIAEALCSPSELKRLQYKGGGLKQPNSRETWIDVEARALYHAWSMIREAYYKIKTDELPAPPFEVDLINRKVEY